VILKEEDVGGREMVTTDEERVLYYCLVFCFRSSWEVENVRLLFAEPMAAQTHVT